MIFWYVLVIVLIFFVVALWFRVLGFKAIIRALQVKNETEMRELRQRLLEETSEILRKKEVEMRKDAIARSQNVTRGKVAEQIAPYIPGFQYDPRDLRFLGSPVDYVVFNGLTAGTLHNIVFLEIKNGRYARLTNRERDVKDVLDLRGASYEILHTGNGEGD